MIGRHRCSLAGLAVATTLVIAAPSNAQFGLEGGYQDAFRPGFTTRDVQLAVDALKLDEAQRFILETLFEDYNEEFRTGVDGFRQSIADLAGTGATDPKAVMRVVFGSMEEWRLESRQLADQFMEDVKGLMNDEQMTLWPGFERKLYRMKYLSNGRLSGENLDLIAIVNEQKLDPDQQGAVADLLAEYEVRLDEALRKREDYINASQALLIEAVQEDRPEHAVEAADRRIQLRVAIRDINEQYTLALREVLASEAGEAFIATVRERTHPRIFRKTNVERLFDAAMKLDDLAEETLQAIAALEEQYLTQLVGFNERMLAAVRDHQPRELRNRVQQSIDRLAGGTPQRLPDPLRQMLTDRREMGSKYVDQLKALLTPEQFAALPGSRRWALPQDKGNVILGGEDGGPAFAPRDAGDGARGKRVIDPGTATGNDAPAKKTGGDD